MMWLRCAPHLKYWRRRVSPAASSDSLCLEAPQMMAWIDASTAIEGSVLRGAEAVDASSSSRLPRSVEIKPSEAGLRSFYSYCLGMESGWSCGVDAVT